MIDYEALAEAMGELDEDVMVETLNKVMEDGGSGAQEAMAACQKGMDIVGSRFESGEYFVGDLIYAGELMTEAVSILKDALVSGEQRRCQDKADSVHRQGRSARHWQEHCPGHAGGRRV